MPKAAADKASGISVCPVRRGRTAKTSDTQPSAQPNAPSADAPGQTCAAAINKPAAVTPVSKCANPKRAARSKPSAVLLPLFSADAPLIRFSKFHPADPGPGFQPPFRRLGATRFCAPGDGSPQGLTKSESSLTRDRHHSVDPQAFPNHEAKRFNLTKKRIEFEF
jgi:hypothetical protein